MARSNSPLDSSRRLLPCVVAVVGCDGSGKSTLSADLIANLSVSGPIEFLYLGQSSGNIGRWIKNLPIVGSTLGRFLDRKAERTHDKKSTTLPVTSALVIFMLSIWRAHKFRRMLKLVRRGSFVITDRYPQAEVAGFYFDGPGLPEGPEQKGFVRWLAAREAGIYRRMARHVPALVLRLNIDAETAHRRKPDHKLAMLRSKTETMPTIQFNGAKICELDSQKPYPEMLDSALEAIRDLREQAHN